MSKCEKIRIFKFNRSQMIEILSKYLESEEGESINNFNSVSFSSDVCDLTFTLKLEEKSDEKSIQT